MAERDDKAFDSEDLLEIFGPSTGSGQAAKPAAVSSPVSNPSTPVHPTQDEEEKLLAAYEQARKAKAPLPGGLSPARLAELSAKAQAELHEHKTGRPVLNALPELGSIQMALPSITPPHPVQAPRPSIQMPVEKYDLPTNLNNDDNVYFMALFEETRRIVFGFLAPLSGIKAANAMLTKTLEKARAKSPVLKDVNWKMDGSLREDGSIDMDRFFKNTGQIEVEKRPAAYFGAFREIMNLRLKSVEAGLGPGPYADLCQRLKELKDAPRVEKQPFKNAADIFFQEVLP